MTEHNAEDVRADCPGCRALGRVLDDYETEIDRLKAALNKLAEDAEVAAQGGIHGST